MQAVSMALGLQAWKTVETVSLFFARYSPG
jgi:hypothetical protein